MKLKFTLLFACALFATMIFAQEEAAPATDKPVEKPWKVSGVVGLNANATGLWNWAAGGKNTVAGVTFGKIRLLYAQNNLSWESNFDIEYGLNWVDQKYDALQKTSDHLKFDTKFGWEFHKSWFFTTSASFQTQMDLGRAYPGNGKIGKINSMILAPSYTDISVGIDWKPNTIFSIYLSPLAGRITTAYVSDKNNNKYTDRMTADGIDLGGKDFRTILQEAQGTWKYDDNNEKVYKNAKAEFGLAFKGAINYTYKDLKVGTTLGLFTPYAWDKTKMYELGGKKYTEKQLTAEQIALAKELGYRDNNRRFGHFDVDWTVMLSYQFLKCLNVTLSTNLKYIPGLKIDKTDKETGVVTSKERVQFMGVLGIGIGYSF